jgi:hypothetical protein
MRLSMFDVQGRLVARLVDAVLPPGRHEAVWDGTSRDGRALGSGIYFCRLEQGAYQAVQKVVLIR